VLVACGAETENRLIPERKRRSEIARLRSGASDAGRRERDKQRRNPML
jgi:hypothetical protein